ncbi:MAG: hypothetical protein AAF431_19605 [Pseudomonadota bacterium]
MDFSLGQEIIKEVIGSTSGVLVLLFGAYITLRMNSHKNVLENRERYVLETLVTAYRRIEQAVHRTPGWVAADPKRGAKVRLEFESAISDIQLLADKENADLAAEFCQNPANEELLQKLIISLRKQLRSRLNLLACTPSWKVGQTRLIE